MSIQSAIFTLNARPVSFPSNVPVRAGLLAELDRKMAKASKINASAHANCPEHLYSIDADKMEMARGLDG